MTKSVTREYLADCIKKEMGLPRSECIKMVSAIFDDMSAGLLLSKILGTCAICGVIVMIASFFLDKLRALITPTVAGTAITLLGITLLQSAFRNFSFALAGADGELILAISAEAMVTLATIFMLSRLKRSLIRVASIPLGLAAGCLIAFIIGDLNFSSNTPSESVFFLTPLNFYLDIDFILLVL